VDDSPNVPVTGRFNALSRVKDCLVAPAQEKHADYGEDLAHDGVDGGDVIGPIFDLFTARQLRVQRVEVGEDHVKHQMHRHEVDARVSSHPEVVLRVSPGSFLPCKFPQ